MTKAKVQSNLIVFPVATVLVVIFAIVGGVVTVTHPETLSFDQYLKNMAIAVAGLGIGRGLDSVSKP